MPRQEAAIKIPYLVKRNTLLIALAQAFVGTGNQLVPALGAIMVVQLVGSASLAGLGTSILGATRFVVAYPIGKITDTFGRRVGLILGLMLSLVGAIGIGSAMTVRSFPLFAFSLIVFGIGVGAGQQLRLAAADMYPPSRRAEGLGYVLTGSIVGALGGPILVSSAQALAPRIGLEAIALAWMLVPLVIIPGLALVLGVRPDPREIALNLPKYYPDYAPPARAAGDVANNVDIRAAVRYYPNLVGFVANLTAQGNMSMVMAMTSFALSCHGFELSAISVSVAIHVLGMFGLSLPLGRLTDRIGRRPVLLLGAILSGVGAVLVAVTTGYWEITAGTFLVGVGWSCVNVAATALIVDNVNPQVRGRVIGVNDALAAVASAVFPLAAGPLVDIFGLGAVGFFGVAIMLPPIAFLLRLKELRPGKYAHA
ncbi:MAG: MFS transporter [Chloroflexi bacterium]|nr:MFS transporter [Chloroflexota bacterium]